MSNRAPVLLVLAVAAAAACSSGSGTPAASPSGSPAAPGSPAPTTAPSPSASAARLILRVTGEGGFIGPAANLNAVPSVSVYADGRILTPGGQAAMYPGPLVPSVSVRDLGPAGAAAIVQAIRAAGLDRDATGSGGGIAGDTGTNVFSVTLDGATVVTRYALGGGAPGPGGPGVPGGPGGSDDPARAAALDLLARLTDPAETWGQPAAPETADVPLGYRVFVAPGAPAVDPAVTQASVAWPLTPGLDEYGTPAVPDRGIPGLRLAAILGADAAAMKPVFDVATSVTPFTSGGQPYTLYVRPLLPDELGGSQ